MKKGFELAISTLVVIALAIILIGVLILAFTGGFSKFWSTLKGYFVSDVQNSIKACETACTAGMNYDYCCRQRDADFGNGKENITCEDLRLKVNCDINCKEVC